MTSEVAGFSESKLSAGRAVLCVRSVVAMAVHRRFVQRRFAETENTARAPMPEQCSQGRIGRRSPGRRRPTCAGCARRSSCPGAARRRRSAFSVGAVLVSDAGTVIATGYSRELDPKDHAEEVALARAADDPRLAGSTLYSSLEPCLSRASRPRSCAELIVSRRDPPRGHRVAGAAVVRRRWWRRRAARRRGHGGRDSVAGRAGPLGQRAPAAAAKRLITVPGSPQAQGCAAPPCRGPCGSSPRLG